ncbi:MaoC/PaaZ C-terminal domain-containing protein [Novosphingobium bradum]|uniref:MaoC/PaaZ C-terminal domain-containing protein n=1 Tax=Novosphingobium bradum TaxID=1737444 RepID=A0ABV7IMB1_9SPHN
MPFKYDDLISNRLEDWSYTYGDKDVLLYNLGIGMGRAEREEELPFVFEEPELKVVPSFAALIAQQGARVIGGAGITVARILHGEERLALYRPLPSAGEVRLNSWISEIVDKGPEKGALITVSSEGRMAGEDSAAFRVDHLIFARADGGCGGPAKSTFVPHQLPEREPDMVYEARTRTDDALLYRLNGDRNPLHAHPAAAKRGGFDRPILHGMCTYGISCRSVLDAVCGLDPTRMKSFDARFTSPIFPGETLHTDIWIDGDIVSFRSRVAARGIVALNNGRCQIGA